MNRILRGMGFGLATAILLSGVPARAGTIDPGLQDVLSTWPADQPISTLVFLSDRVDLAALTALLDQEGATLQRRHEVVVRSLQEKAQATQGSLTKQLIALQAEGRVNDLEAFWINNSFRVDALPAEIVLLAERLDVDTIYYNLEIEAIRPVGTPGGDEGSPRSPEPGLAVINAPQAWAAGFTGDGVLISSLDTGVDGNHSALASRWRGVADSRYAGHPQWAWFDPQTSTTFPGAFGAHGTHTMGTMCGGAPGDQIGVAPGAQWIHAAVIDRASIATTVAQAILAFQWIIDPDGNPSTIWDVPAVCCNSWGVTTGHGYPPCDQTFWSVLDADEAAGIVVVFAAGNEGSGAETLRRPSDRATTETSTFAVGAVDGAGSFPWTIADFSSRGPSHCTPGGSAAIKPEVCAPGVNVRSSVPGGGYEGGWSGTSMATPHVSGAVALIRQACPNLTVQEIKQILIDTARDEGPTGNDNNYGYGVIDAYAAVVMALSMCGPHPPRAFDGSYQSQVTLPVTMTLGATDYDGGPQPMVYIVSDLPTGTFTDLGNGHVISPSEIPYTLVNHGNQLTYASYPASPGTKTFHFRANDGGTPPTGGDSPLATITITVSYGGPMITTAAVPSGVVNQPYAPVQFEISPSGGQPPLTWSLAALAPYVELDSGSNQFAEVGTARNWRADDAVWSYTLPFAFPFYGTEHTSVWVCSNGFLHFGPSSSASPDNSDIILKAAIRIAPMWDDLRTTGTGHDIFIDSGTSGQVTVRWAAETVAVPNVPCNFSVTLYQDGRIRFHYGAGNTNLTPTIGISRGSGTQYTLSIYDNAPSLTNANSNEFTPPTSLPAGMTFSAGGVFSGTPTTTGTFIPTFKVTDALNRSNQRALLLVINSAPSNPINCDGTPVFDLTAELPCFVHALLGVEDAPGSIARCDLNTDGSTDGVDIAVWVDCVVNGVCP